MKTWSFILSKLEQNQDLVLLVVIDNQGSSPGKKGFKMAVSGDGQLHGSIGGGIMENQMVEEARQIILRKDSRIFLKHQEHNPDAEKDKSGMICSGSQAIAFYPIDKTQVAGIEKIAGCNFKNENCVIKYSSSGIELTTIKQKEKYQGIIHSDMSWELTEHLGLSNKLYIFGAGHVGLALSQVCSLMDFEIEIFDNREELSTFNENDFVSKKSIVDYNNISDLITEGPTSFAVITSHTHLEDEILLGQLLTKPLKYLGMLGSRKKVEKIKSNLIAKGHQEEEFKSLRSPVGIDIKSQTPIEIAISIAAEMISIKNSVTE